MNVGLYDVNVRPDGVGGAVHTTLYDPGSHCSPLPACQHFKRGKGLAFDSGERGVHIMMGRFSGLFVLGVVFFLTAVSAAAASVSVTAEGVGVIVGDNTANARDQAVQDALRMAVEQAVGTMVSSETLVQNYETLRDEIYARTQGYVQRYDIVDETVVDNLYRVTIEARVAQGRLENDIMALGLLMSRKNMPRVMIMVAEQNIGMTYYAFWWGIRTGAAELTVTENTLMEVLGQKGFQVVDHAVRSGTVAVADPYRITSLTDDAIREIGVLFDAEVVIYGKALAKLAGAVQGTSMKSVQADVSLRAVNTGNGRVLASAIHHAAAVHPSEVAAGTKALQQAARAAAEALMAQIVDRWNQDVISGGTVELVISGIRSYSHLVRFKETLQKEIRGIKGVHQRDFKDQHATVDVTTTASTQMLADEIVKQSYGSFAVDVVRISQNRIALEMR